MWMNVLRIRKLSHETTVTDGQRVGLDLSWPAAGPAHGAAHPTGYAVAWTTASGRHHAVSGAAYGSGVVI